eukprot:5636015-Pyramimonas_sp.AAC.1
MLDTPLGGLDRLKHMVLARDNHVISPPGWPGHVKAWVPALGNHVRYTPGWPAHVKTTWSLLGAAKLDAPLGGLDT